MEDMDDACTVCHKQPGAWRPNGFIGEMCTGCYTDYLQQPAHCGVCRHEDKLGNLCYDGWKRYYYWCKACLCEELSRLSPRAKRSLYEEFTDGAYTMFEEVEREKE